MNKILVFIGILVVFSLCTGVVSAADWTVNPGDSIQAVVNGAGDNDTVIVNDDNGTAYTYTENVVINKKLTVTAASGANVTIQAFDTSFPVFDIENNCNGSAIHNFTITGATGSVGIYLENSDSITISGNTIVCNFWGICLKNSYKNTISQNYISDNDYGFYFESSGNNTLTGNILATNYNGMWLDNSGSNTLTGNTITNHYTYGVVLDYSDNNTISSNNISNNYNCWGIWLYNSGNNTLTTNQLASNNVGMWLDYSPNNTISGNNGSNNDYGFYLDYSDNNLLFDNNLTVNWVGLKAHYSNNSTLTRNSITDNNGSGIIFYYSSGNINFNRIFGNGLEYEGYGFYNDGPETVDATDNWWGSDDPMVSLTGPSDIGIAGGTVLYDPWFETDIAFTVDAVKTASEVVKTYIETNHQLPCCTDISGIEVNMAQFLKLSTQAVLNINNEFNNTLILGGFQNAASPLENITMGVVFDAEFVDLAAFIKTYMDSNGQAPNYVADTSLGDFVGFESLVYMYSQILKSYNSTMGVLPDSVSVVPWIAVSNPNMVYNFRTQEFFNTIQAAIDDADTQNNDTITLGDGIFTENVDVNKRLKITSLSGNTKVNAANTDLPVFSILFDGSGSIIQNLIIMGATGNAGIYINNSNNNTLFQNNLTSNLNGIHVENSTYNTISGNIITNNTVDGVFIYSCLNSTISDNAIKSNTQNGIKMIGSTNIDTSHNIVSDNDVYGIYSENSTADVKFNVITGNTGYGVYNAGNGTLDTQNNWWGSNFQGTDPFTVGVVNTGVNATTWLVLNVTSSCDRSNRTGLYYNYITTADLTRNNHGEDTSSDSCIPNDLVIYFNSTLGTINSSSSIRNGKAVTTLNSTTSGTANVTVSLDNQTITTSINVMSVNELGIYNTRTNEGFSSIQTAIDDVDTLNEDIITLKDGTYTENVVVNKKLIIKPVTGVMQKNLLPYNVATFENGSVSEWHPSDNAIKEIDSSNAYSGSYCLKHTANSSGDDGALTLLDGVPTAGSLTVSFSVKMKGTGSTRVFLNAYDSSGSYVGTYAVSSTYVAGSSYTIIAIEDVSVSSGASYSKIVFRPETTGVFYWDELQLELGPTATTFEAPTPSSTVTGENVFVQAADPDSCVFTITGAGNGSLIQGFTINGGLYGIFLNSTSGCNIAENTLLDNKGGIYLYNATNSNITGNTVVGNGFGINLDDSNYNILSGNNVKGNLDGINLYGSNNNIITENSVKNNYNGIYLYNSNNTTITENIITNNGVGIAYIDSDSTTLSGNNVTDNWIENTSQVDTTGIIMAINEYYCGPATLATVLKNLGINATQEDLATLAGTDETGTTMYGLAQAAQSKGLIAKGLKLSVSQLRTNNIVFLIINGEGHYCIVTNITDMMVYLADTDLGNINMTVTNFTAAYSGNALVVTNDTNDTQLNTGTELTNQEMQDIKGNGAWIKVWVYGWFWHWGKWVYGSWWSYAGHPKGNTHWFIWHRPSWHYKYGWFRIKYWHTIYIWCSGTLPMNYVRFFTPRSYESLHYWGQQ